eukprot:TRINITY_DN7134_c0_g1_i3.p1 TRINITY_DN7134_c0_g1~~TRINITY_DN7134_c0_g1_i3.p1  ORF type:complete len:369 (+),score=45.19 TRINITY_DN7134_c0_g1_i3:75-1181(+)
MSLQKLSGGDRMEAYRQGRLSRIFQSPFDHVVPGARRFGESHPSLKHYIFGSGENEIQNCSRSIQGIQKNENAKEASMIDFTRQSTHTSNQNEFYLGDNEHAENDVQDVQEPRKYSGWPERVEIMDICSGGKKGFKSRCQDVYNVCHSELIGEQFEEDVGCFTKVLREEPCPIKNEALDDNLETCSEKDRNEEREDPFVLDDPYIKYLPDSRRPAPRIERNPQEGLSIHEQRKAPPPKNKPTILEILKNSNRRLRAAQHHIGDIRAEANVGQSLHKAHDSLLEEGNNLHLIFDGFSLEGDTHKFEKEAYLKEAQKRTFRRVSDSLRMDRNTLYMNKRGSDYSGNAPSYNNRGHLYSRESMNEDSWDDL